MINVIVPKFTVLVYSHNAGLLLLLKQHAEHNHGDRTVAPDHTLLVTLLV
jgi:hypothetical protein